MSVRLWIAGTLLCIAATGAYTQPQPPLTGIVFEDTNRNGQRDPGA